MVADNFYGEDRGLRGGLQKLKVPYVMALKPSHTWWHPESVAGSLQDVAHEAGWESAEHPGQVGTDHQNLPRWQHTRVVGAGDRGRTVWARQDGTSGGGHHRSTDLARSHHLVSGDQPACSHRVSSHRNPCSPPRAWKR